MVEFNPNHAYYSRRISLTTYMSITYVKSVHNIIRLIIVAEAYPAYNLRLSRTVVEEREGGFLTFGYFLYCT